MQYGGPRPPGSVTAASQRASASDPITWAAAAAASAGIETRAGPPGIMMIKDPDHGTPAVTVTVPGRRP